jgi:hypothetical protein
MGEGFVFGQAGGQAGLGKLSERRLGNPGLYESGNAGGGKLSKRGLTELGDVNEGEIK